MHQVLKPMAKIATAAVADNGLQDVVKVIPKRSTELVVGIGEGLNLIVYVVIVFINIVQCFVHAIQDMSRRANVLVTEIFDTELLGEGVLSTLAHAWKHLLEVGARCACVHG